MDEQPLQSSENGGPTLVPEANSDHLSAEQGTRLKMVCPAADGLTACKLVILKELLQESRERTKCFQAYHSLAMQKNEILRKSVETCTSQLQTCMNKVEGITGTIGQLIAEKTKLEIEAEGVKQDNLELKERLAELEDNANNNDALKCSCTIASKQF